MCGLVGVAGNLKPHHYQIFRDLLLYDMVRGYDSTGIATMDLKGGIRTFKAMGTPDKLFGAFKGDLFTNAKGKNKDGIVKGKYKVLMGHNRWATVGDLVVGNAHPFIEGSIVGAHNGTLRDYVDLIGHDTKPVDSQALFSHINEKGIVDAWGNFRGAAAITYMDSQDGTLNIVRNDERPLEFYMDGDVIIWASLSWMIEFACVTAGVDIDYSKIKTLKVDTHAVVTFDENNVASITSKEGLEPKKWFTPSAGSSVVGFRGYRSSFKGANEDPKLVGGKRKAKAMFNLNWAQNLEKAPPEYVGERFVILYAMYETDEYWEDPFWVCLTESGDRINVYPGTPFQQKKFKHFYDKDNDQIYEITSRPRMFPGKTWSKETQYGISTQHVTRSGVDPYQYTGQTCEEYFSDQDKLDEKDNKFIRGYGGIRVTEGEFNEQMNQLDVSWCCTSCLNVFEKEDADDIVWATTTVALCKECGSDPSLVTMAYHCR